MRKRLSKELTEVTSLKDIAAACGVSVATVSKALNGAPDIGEETRRRIREKAEDLMKNKDYLTAVYREGADKAASVANRTLRKVYKKVGFVER